MGEKEQQEKRKAKYWKRRNLIGSFVWKEDKS
jgi:hypothetical protein